LTTCCTSVQNFGEKLIRTATVRANLAGARRRAARQAAQAARASASGPAGARSPGRLACSPGRPCPEAPRTPGTPRRTEPPYEHAMDRWSLHRLTARTRSEASPPVHWSLGGCASRLKGEPTPGRDVPRPSPPHRAVRRHTLGQPRRAPSPASCAPSSRATTLLCPTHDSPFRARAPPSRPPRRSSRSSGRRRQQPRHAPAGRPLLTNQPQTEP
jgi:hypothetical protein